MSADVHPVALVSDGAADPADRVRCLDYDRPDSSPALEFKCRSQASWPGPDDHCRSLAHFPLPNDFVITKLLSP